MRNLFRDRETRQLVVAYWIGVALVALGVLWMGHSDPRPIVFSWQKIVLMCILHLASAVGVFIMMLRLEGFSHSVKKKKG